MSVSRSESIVLDRGRELASKSLVWLERNARNLLIIGVVGYILVFGAAACYKYWASWMGFDLAVHLQVLWNTGHGRIAASSPSAGTSSYFGIDIIITELLLSPLYRLIPSPYFILLLQTVVVGLGALPIYHFARVRLLNRFAGVVFAAAYLLYAPVEWTNLYEFQIRAFATTFMLSALYCLQLRRLGWFYLWTLLALGCRADVGIAVAGMGVLFLLGEWPHWQAASDSRHFLALHKKPLLLYGLLPILLGLSWMLLCVLVLVPSFRSDGEFLYTSVIYGWLGDSPSEMIWRMLSDPGYVLNYVFGSNDGIKRMRYLLEMFLPFAFLLFLAPRYLLPTLPFFAINLLSNTPQLHASTHYHYQALIVPFMVIGSIEGMRWLQYHVFASQNNKDPHHRALQSQSLLFFLLAMALACNLIFRNPLFSIVTRPVMHERNQIAAELMRHIPADAAVAATNSFGPPLAHRQELYVFPGDDIIYPVAYSSRAEYLMVDTGQLDADDLAYFDQLRASGQYEQIEARSYFNLDRKSQEELSVWRKK